LELLSAIGKSTQEILWKQKKKLPLKDFSLGRNCLCIFFALKTFSVCNRVARWVVFEPKIQIWANFGGP
jgi:hypothetical protein